MSFLMEGQEEGDQCLLVLNGAGRLGGGEEGQHRDRWLFLEQRLARQQTLSKPYCVPGLCELWRCSTDPALVKVSG